MEQEHVQIGEIELPIDYFKLSIEDKNDLCMGLIEVMLDILDKTLPQYVSRFDILDKLLDSSIITNLEHENYEICAVLEKCKQIINESKD